MVINLGRKNTTLINVHQLLIDKQQNKKAAISNGFLILNIENNYGIVKIVGADQGLTIFVSLPR